jgi:hypothetical protein
MAADPNTTTTSISASNASALPPFMPRGLRCSSALSELDAEAID